MRLQNGFERKLRPFQSNQGSTTHAVTLNDEFAKLTTEQKSDNMILKEYKHNGKPEWNRTTKNNYDDTYQLMRKQFT